MNKVYYDEINDVLLLCLGNATLKGFKRYLIQEKPIYVEYLTNTYFKHKYIYIGKI